MARLTWDNFPRSGSAWLARTLDLCFPSYDIVWGGHRSSTFIDSPNCITVIRNPRQTITSYIEFFNEKNISSVIDWYFRFINRTIEYKDYIYISLFEDLTKNPLHEMQKYSAKFGLMQPKHVVCEQISEAVSLTHPQHLPRTFSKKREQIQKTVNNSDKLFRSIELYEYLLGEQRNMPRVVVE